MLNGSFNDRNIYSYAGPGTEYIKQVKKGYQGINKLDKMAKLYNQFYNGNLDIKSRNISNIAIVHRAHRITDNPTYNKEQ